MYAQAGNTRYVLFGLVILCASVGAVRGDDPDVRYLLAPQSSPFIVEDPAAGQLGETARRFVQQVRSFLGVTSDSVAFGVDGVESEQGLAYVKLRQMYSGIPFFGARVIVRLNPPDAVEYLVNGIVQDTSLLDQGGLNLTPTLDPNAALDIAIQQYVPGAPDPNLVIVGPELKIFDPILLTGPGPIHLVWDLSLARNDDPFVGGHFLVNAHTGAIEREYLWPREALNRRIRDADDMNDNGTLERAEGDPASPVADVNSAYAFLGDAYDYFWNNYSRDSYDNSGATIRATVRWCASDPNDPNVPCPWNNAMFNGWRRFYFGSGWVVDDVVAHEFTHAVTDASSDLIYENTPGAINEAISDIFGEFIDWTNGAGNDDPNVAWLCGEDLPGGAIRSMRNPPAGNDPDRVGSPLYTPPVSSPTNNNDYGGVHRNSGIVNKLAYLLTDGDTFNNWTVTGLGLTQTSGLFYTTNNRYLGSAATFSSLYDALHYAAIHESWSASDRNNLYRACEAVEIADREDVWVDISYTVNPELGVPTAPFDTVNEGIDSARPGDRLIIRDGTYDESILIEETMTVEAVAGATVVIVGQ